MAARKAKSKASPKPGKESSPPKVAASKTKPSKGTRRRYSDAERQRILETARREGLSGPKAAKRFGISTLTFYNWRKAAVEKKSAPQSRTQATTVRAREGDLARQMRAEVRDRVAQMLPEIIASELDAILGTGGSRRRSR